MALREEPTSLSPSCIQVTTTTNTTSTIKMADDDDLSVLGAENDFTGLPDELHEARTAVFLHACANEAAQITATLAAFDDDQQQQVLTWQAPRGSHRFTPLIYAAFYGRTLAVQALLAHGSDPVAQANVRGNSAKRQTALHYATSDLGLTHQGGVTEEMRAACIVELIARGANPDLQTSRTMFTPLHKACWSGLTLCRQALLDGGANASLRNKYGEVPQGL